MAGWSRTRARVVLLAVIALVASMVSPSGGRSVRHLVVNRVDAAFIYPTAKPRRYDYLVFYALRRTDPSTGRVVSTKAYAGQGHCVRRRGRGISCQTKVDRHRLALFQANDDLTRLHVVLARAGTRHRLRFRTTADYQAAGREIPNECGGASVRRYEVARHAVAFGMLFGRSVRTQTERGKGPESVTRYGEISACP